MKRRTVKKMYKMFADIYWTYYTSKDNRLEANLNHRWRQIQKVKDKYGEGTQYSKKRS